MSDNKPTLRPYSPDKITVEYQERCIFIHRNDSESARFFVSRAKQEARDFAMKMDKLQELIDSDEGENSGT